MRKLFADIHFSIHSILVKKLAVAGLDLKKAFFHWICRGAAEEIENDSYDQISWLESPISKIDFPEGIEWRDVRDYAQALPLKKKSLSQTENEEYKILRMETAESLFDRFLHEGLNDGQKLLVEVAWNDTYNSFRQVDYDNFDYSLYGFSGTYNGKPFVFHEQQNKGMAFLCTKENGLLAYDVGVGKTATGIEGTRRILPLEIRTAKRRQHQGSVPDQRSPWEFYQSRCLHGFYIGCQPQGQL